MRTKIMIDSIVRQTTVLIAQLASSAGLRAPLAHIADEVFLSLSRQLETEGVPQKVAADMFGLALRTYQRRVRRLREGGTEKGATLWPSILDYLKAHPGGTRGEVLHHFSAEEPAAVGAVLADLVRTGLASKTGSGPNIRYTTTSEEVRKLIARQQDQELIRPMVWLEICRSPGADRVLLAARLELELSEVDEAVKELTEENHLKKDENGGLEAISPLEIPEGSEVGWEAAVLDHYQAVVQTISGKLEGPRVIDNREVIGGGTLSFDLPDGHPDREEVMSLLERTREETRTLWERVTEYNAKQSTPLDSCPRVVFYFGQTFRTEEEDDA